MGKTVNHSNRLIYQPCLKLNVTKMLVKFSKTKYFFFIFFFLFLKFPISINVKKKFTSRRFQKKKRVRRIRIHNNSGFLNRVPKHCLTNSDVANTGSVKVQTKIYCRSWNLFFPFRTLRIKLYVKFGSPHRQYLLRQNS